MEEMIVAFCTPGSPLQAAAVKFSFEFVLDTWRSAWLKGSTVKIEFGLVPAPTVDCRIQPGKLCPEVDLASACGSATAGDRGLVPESAA